MSPDPNWLFSATAQSAAAVFAIVAGFITTRILTLGVERRAITSQILQRQVRLNELEEHRGKLRRDKIEIVVDRMREHLKDTHVSGDDPLPPQEIAKRNADKDVPEDRLAREYQRLTVDLTKALEFITANVHTINYRERNVRAWLNSIGAETSEFDADFIQFLYETKRDELEWKAKSSTSPWSVPTLPSSLAAASRQLATDPLDEVNARLNETDLEMHLLARDVQILRERAPSLVMPRTAWWAIAILAFIGASGVVLPLSLIPAVSEERWMRPVIVGLFAFGLAALMVYIVAEFSSMLRPPGDPGSPPPAN